MLAMQPPVADRALRRVAVEPTIGESHKPDPNWPCPLRRSSTARETATQTRGRYEVYFVGKQYEVTVRVVDRNLLGERSPRGEARLKLSIADLLIPGYALRTISTPAYKRHSHSIALLELLNIRPDALDDARQLVPRDMRQPNVGIVPHPTMPVAPANPARPNGNDDSVPSRLWLWDITDLHWCPKRLVDHGFHSGHYLANSADIR